MSDSDIVAAKEKSAGMRGRMDIFQIRSARAGNNTIFIIDFIK
ncbi:hypothetical protein ACFL7M_04460 [Thermodesulfobacteriota bacterium]